MTGMRFILTRESRFLGLAATLNRCDIYLRMLGRIICRRFLGRLVRQIRSKALCLGHHSNRTKLYRERIIDQNAKDLGCEEKVQKLQMGSLLRWAVRRSALSVYGIQTWKL